MEQTLDQMIYDLAEHPASATRLIRILRENGVETMEDFCSASIREMENYKGLGKRTRALLKRLCGHLIQHAVNKAYKKTQNNYKVFISIPDKHAYDRAVGLGIIDDDEEIVLEDREKRLESVAIQYQGYLDLVKDEVFRNAVQNGFMVTIYKPVV